MSDVAKLIKRTRLGCGLTQTELARLAGTTQSAVGRVEAGRSMPSLRTVERLLQAMGRTLVVDVRPLEATETGIDRSLILANVRRTPAERLGQLDRMTAFAGALREARRVAP